MRKEQLDGLYSHPIEYLFGNVFHIWTNEMVEDNLEGGEGWQEHKHTGP